MKILYFKWNSFGADDILEAFENLRHDVVVIPWDRDNIYRDEILQKKIVNIIKSECIDIAFSSDYYPPIAAACYEIGIKYISWVYDSPYVSLYSFTTSFETNCIFVFDRAVVEEFNTNNVRTVHYMPLAANPKRLRKMIEDPGQQKLFRESMFFNRGEVAFVGAMYDEENTFYRKLEGISDHTRGYLEGIMAAQKQIWGYNFVRSMMRNDILDDMYRVYPLRFDKDCVAGRDFVYAEYCINREITARERMEYISEIGQMIYGRRHTYVDLYTVDENLELPGVCNHGYVGPERIAPFVYDRAKINLNITLRSIHSGIPLRAFEIMGSGGFLLSNYQADFADCYVDGEDYVSFGDKEDMFEKIEYYLSHENERAAIAANGLRRTLNDHTYEHRIDNILNEEI